MDGTRHAPSATQHMTRDPVSGVAYAFTPDGELIVDAWFDAGARLPEHYVSAFSGAAQAGDLEALVNVLDPRVAFRAVSTPGPPAGPAAGSSSPAPRARDPHDSSPMEVQP